MTKAKLCSFAIAGAIGLASLSPVTTIAAETTAESTTQTENKTDHKVKKAEFEKKMKAAREKWNALTQEQKNEIYAMLENEMNEENRILDKLVELGVFEQSDIGSLKEFRLDRYNRMKESGEFPFARGRGRK